MTLIIMEMGKFFGKRDSFCTYVCTYFNLGLRFISLQMLMFGFHVIVQDKGMEFHLAAIDTTAKVISTENVSLKEA